MTLIVEASQTATDLKKEKENVLGKFLLIMYRNFKKRNFSKNKKK